MFYSVQLQEDRDFHYSSDAELDREDACERGSHSPDQEWVLSDRDVWHKNPYFTGTPSGRHPEDDHYEEDGVDTVDHETGSQDDIDMYYDDSDLFSL